MSTNQKNSSLQTGLEQTVNNTTSWIGHANGDSKEIVKGQTFVSSSEGDLVSVEIFSNMVTRPGNVIMTVHSFDPQKKAWSNPLGTTTVAFNNDSTGKWVPFPISGLRLAKGQSYGFRLVSPDSLIGVGEAAGSFKNPPLNAGQEWRFTNNDAGDSFSYFSLAFKVGIRA